MRLRFIVIVAVAGLLATAGFAHADGFLSPGLGVAFGNASAQGRANFVFDLGWLPRRSSGS